MSDEKSQSFLPSQVGVAMTDDNPNHYPEGSIFMDCQGTELKDLETLAVNRTAWRHKVAALVF